MDNVQFQDLTDARRFALPVFQSQAEARDSFAMARLAEYYINGYVGVRKNDAEALRWMRGSAERNDAYALGAVGEFYLAGIGGVRVDEKEAVRCFRRAAERGDATGLAHLGAMYLKGGGGLPRDEHEAVRLFKEGVQKCGATASDFIAWLHRNGIPGNLALALYHHFESKESAAMNNLGAAYKRGIGGMPQDDAEALNWYIRAAAKGNLAGLKNVEWMRAHGHGVSENSRQTYRRDGPRIRHEPLERLGSTDCATRLFISHNNRDAEVAGLLGSLIRRFFGAVVSVFNSSDPLSLSTGEQWEPATLSRLSGSHGCIVLLSSSSLQSQWVEREFRIAQQNDIHVLPMLWGSVEAKHLPEQYSRFHVRRINNPDHVLSLMNDIWTIHRKVQRLSGTFWELFASTAVSWAGPTYVRAFLDDLGNTEHT